MGEGDRTARATHRLYVAGHGPARGGGDSTSCREMPPDPFVSTMSKSSSEVEVV